MFKNQKNIASKKVMGGTTSSTANVTPTVTPAPVDLYNRYINKRLRLQGQNFPNMFLSYDSAINFSAVLLTNSTSNKVLALNVIPGVTGITNTVSFEIRQPQLSAVPLYLYSDTTVADYKLKLTTTRTSAGIYDIMTGNSCGTITSDCISLRVNGTNKYVRHSGYVYYAADLGADANLPADSTFLVTILPNTLTNTTVAPSRFLLGPATPTQSHFTTNKEVFMVELGAEKNRTDNIQTVIDTKYGGKGYILATLEQVREYIAKDGDGIGPGFIYNADFDLDPSVTNKYIVAAALRYGNSRIDRWGSIELYNNTSFPNGAVVVDKTVATSGFAYVYGVKPASGTANHYGFVNNYKWSYYGQPYDGYEAYVVYNVSDTAITMPSNGDARNSTFDNISTAYGASSGTGVTLGLVKALGGNWTREAYFYNGWTTYIPIKMNAGVPGPFSGTAFAPVESNQALTIKAVVLIGKKPDYGDHIRIVELNGVKHTFAAEFYDKPARIWKKGGTAMSAYTIGNLQPEPLSGTNDPTFLNNKEVFLVSYSSPTTIGNDIRLKFINGLQNDTNNSNNSITTNNNNDIIYKIATSTQIRKSMTPPSATSFGMDNCWYGWMVNDDPVNTDSTKNIVSGFPITVQTGLTGCGSVVAGSPRLVYDNPTWPTALYVWGVKPNTKKTGVVSVDNINITYTIQPYNDYLNMYNRTSAPPTNFEPFLVRLANSSEVISSGIIADIQTLGADVGANFNAKRITSSFYTSTDPKFTPAWPGSGWGMFGAEIKPLTVNKTAKRLEEGTGPTYNYTTNTFSTVVNANGFILYGRKPTFAERNKTINGRNFVVEYFNTDTNFWSMYDTTPTSVASSSSSARIASSSSSAAQQLASSSSSAKPAPGGITCSTPNITYSQVSKNSTNITADSVINPVDTRWFVHITNDTTANTTPTTISTVSDAFLYYIKNRSVVRSDGTTWIGIKLSGSASAPYKYVEVVRSPPLTANDPNCFIKRNSITGTVIQLSSTSQTTLSGTVTNQYVSTPSFGAQIATVYPATWFGSTNYNGVSALDSKLSSDTTGVNVAEEILRLMNMDTYSLSGGARGLDMLNTAIKAYSSSLICNTNEALTQVTYVSSIGSSSSSAARIGSSSSSAAPIGSSSSSMARIGSSSSSAAPIGSSSSSAARIGSSSSSAAPIGSSSSSMARIGSSSSSAAPIGSSSSSAARIGSSSSSAAPIGSSSSSMARIGSSSSSATQLQRFTSPYTTPEVYICLLNVTTINLNSLNGVIATQFPSGTRLATQLDAQRDKSTGRYTEYYLGSQGIYSNNGQYMVTNGNGVSVANDLLYGFGTQINTQTVASNAILALCLYGPKVPDVTTVSFSSFANMQMRSANIYNITVDSSPITVEVYPNIRTGQPVPNDQIYSLNDRPVSIGSSSSSAARIGSSSSSAAPIGSSSSSGGLPGVGSSSSSFKGFASSSSSFAPFGSSSSSAAQRLASSSSSAAPITLTRLQPKYTTAEVYLLTLLTTNEMQLKLLVDDMLLILPLGTRVATNIDLVVNNNKDLTNINISGINSLTTSIVINNIQSLAPTGTSISGYTINNAFYLKDLITANTSTLVNIRSNATTAAPRRYLFAFIGPKPDLSLRPGYDSTTATTLPISRPNSSGYGAYSIFANNVSYDSAGLITSAYYSVYDIPSGSSSSSAAPIGSSSSSMARIGSSSSSAALIGSSSSSMARIGSSSSSAALIGSSSSSAVPFGSSSSSAAPFGSSSSSAARIGSSSSSAAPFGSSSSSAAPFGSSSSSAAPFGSSSSSAARIGSSSSSAARIGSSSSSAARIGSSSSSAARIGSSSSSAAPVFGSSSSSAVKQLVSSSSSAAPFASSSSRATTVFGSSSSERKQIASSSYLPPLEQPQTFASSSSFTSGIPGVSEPSQPPAQPASAPAPAPTPTISTGRISRISSQLFPVSYADNRPIRFSNIVEILHALRGADNASIRLATVEDLMTATKFGLNWCFPSYIQKSTQDTALVIYAASQPGKCGTKSQRQLIKVSVPDSYTLDPTYVFVFGPKPDQSFSTGKIITPSGHGLYIHNFYDPITNISGFRNRHEPFATTPTTCYNSQDCANTTVQAAIAEAAAGTLTLADPISVVASNISTGSGSSASNLSTQAPALSNPITLIGQPTTPLPITELVTIPASSVQTYNSYYTTPSQASSSAAKRPTSTYTGPAPTSTAAPTTKPNVQYNYTIVQNKLAQAKQEEKQATEDAKQAQVIQYVESTAPPVAEEEDKAPIFTYDPNANFFANLLSEFQSDTLRVLKGVQAATR
jgi:hypothetical protein